MSIIRDLLRDKGTQVWTVAAEATVIEALRLMAAKNIGALVVSKGDEILGVFSERDYARQSTLFKRLEHDVPVSQLMTKNVICISPEQNIDDCMKVMTNKRIRHLPVLENNKMIGIISIGDVVNKIISDQQDTIKQLNNYISGSTYGSDV